ncbi:Glycogen synthase [Falsiruegeria litorea R37]|uniref:Glycogen synthase n=1 Tax=Falsiruegeria litorea R37 TaxID=1200284 RepID=A0A1Y5TZJ2_9RHOB|nr:glycosyltransferase [Falsiruegeria litorea]SLN74486.1 Glycogen synthase [Falsiruegeria litorea R37]
MNIVMFTPNYLPAMRYGGPVRSTHGLARGLVDLGHRVDVLTTDVDGPGRLDVALDRPSDMDGVSVHYCSISAPRRFYYSPALAKRAASLLPDADAIHVNGMFLWPGPHLARAARRSGKTLVISPRGMLMPEMVAGKSRLAKSVWITGQERANLAAATAIHVTSAGEAEGLSAMGLDLAPVAVIGNGVETPPRLPDAAEINAVWGDVPQGQRVAFLARLDWTKGVDMAIEAARAQPGAVIRLAGHDQIGLQAELTQRLIRSDGSLAGAFLGPLDGMQKWAFLAGADVLLVPSVRESFGMSVAEAMSMGTPVIATDGVGAAPLLAKLDAGLVVPREQGALNGALARLLADEARRNAIGRASREMAMTELSWTGIATQMASLYQIAQSGGAV